MEKVNIILKAAKVIFGISGKTMREGAQHCAANKKYLSNRTQPQLRSCGRVADTCNCGASCACEVRSGTRWRSTCRDRVKGHRACGAPRQAVDLVHLQVRLIQSESYSEIKISVLPPKNQNESHELPPANIFFGSDPLPRDERKVNRPDEAEENEVFTEQFCQAQNVLKPPRNFSNSNSSPCRTCDLPFFLLS